MPTTHDSNERRQAIWPYLLMPAAVLLVYYTLQRFQDAALAAAQATPAHTAAIDDSTGP